MTKLAFDVNGTGTPNTHKRRLPYACRLLLLAEVAACSSQPLASGDGGIPDAAVQPAIGTIAISAATRKPRTTTLSVNYWNWMPSYEDDVSGTEAAIAPLRPALMRVGGYNNDANMADPFDDAQFDKAVAYARAIGAEPLIQVPLLANIDGSPPTASTAAAMVSYANVTKGYGIKYFSIGNEPDLYATQGSLTDSTKPAIPGYQPSDYCASVRAYVAAMKAVDGTIEIVGPDLSWHYIPGNDWLTPILQGCGDLFDIVSIHRYPFNSEQATLDAATGDATTFANTLASVRALMQAVGYGDKPLALTEMNIVYDATACQLGASPGTIGSALWLADGLGTAIQNALWTSAIWDLGDNDLWAFGLVGPPPLHTPSPEYYAYQLYADHFGPTLLEISPVTDEHPCLRQSQPGRRRDRDHRRQLEHTFRSTGVSGNGLDDGTVSGHLHRAWAVDLGGGDPGHRRHPGVDLQRAAAPGRSGADAARTRRERSDGRWPSPVDQRLLSRCFLHLPEGYASKPGDYDDGRRLWERLVVRHPAVPVAIVHVRLERTDHADRHGNVRRKRSHDRGHLRSAGQPKLDGRWALFQWHGLH